MRPGRSTTSIGATSHAASLDSLIDQLTDRVDANKDGKISYDTTVFKVIAGKTLGYGDEYVHSAPNGYGMAPGTFNPNATGEFCWGCMDT